MSTVRVGALMAAVIAGPPLYALVSSGDLDATAAFERGAVVLIACAVGASWVVNIAKGYERQARREHQQKERRIRQSLDGLVPEEPSDGSGR